MVPVNYDASERQLTYLHLAQLLYLYQCAELVANYWPKLLTFNVGWKICANHRHGSTSTKYESRKVISCLDIG